ncbi:MAG: class sortase [Marmoricola sp.]|nr:class sortase [Marmoricola sp.]
MAREAPEEPQVEGWIFDPPSQRAAPEVEQVPIDALVAEALKARSAPAPVDLAPEATPVAQPPVVDLDMLDPRSNAETPEPSVVDLDMLDPRSNAETPAPSAETPPPASTGWVYQASVGEQWAPRAPVQVVPAREMPDIDVAVPEEEPEVEGWVFTEVAETDPGSASDWIFAEPPARPLPAVPEPEEEPEDPFPVVKKPRIGKRRREPHPAERARLRWMKVALVTVLLALCAVIPFAVPQIASLFGDAVPKHPAVITDPPVGPITQSPQTLTSPAPSIVAQRLAAAGVPLEVSVPRLHVDSVVVPISGQSGELLPPSDPQELGWWQEGRQVGARQGSAVVTGHTVHTGGGAFDHLGELVPGDRIRVRTSAGWITYDVEQSQTVTVAQLAATADQIFQQAGPSRLVLITCSNFNGVVYLTNSVVYAVPIKDAPYVPAGAGQLTHGT